MRAIRCANSEHSALNAGVPTDPHSPESNSSYLAQIWSIGELYSLCASCKVIKKTSLGMIKSDKYKFVNNFNVGDIRDAKQVWSLWGLSSGQLSSKWLEILKKLSRQKLVCEKSNFCKIQGMSEWLERCMLHCCMLAVYLLVLLGTLERVQITFCIIVQIIWIKKYFELVLRISTYFKLSPVLIWMRNTSN